MSSENGRRGDAWSSADAHFREIFERESPYVWHTLRRLGVRDADLEDVVHDVFLRIHKKLGEYDSSRSIHMWIFGFAYRAAAGYRRLARHRREVFDESVEAVDATSSADAQLAAEEQRRLVARALDELDFDQRAVLVLHDIDGVAVPAIADALGIPANTAYSRLRLAREGFARAVKRRRTGGRR